MMAYQSAEAMIKNTGATMMHALTLTNVGLEVLELMQPDGIVHLSFDDAKVIPADGRSSYDELERELKAAHILAGTLVLRCIAAEAERDMLARKVQELTAPTPSPAFEQLGHEITHALSVMDEIRRNRR